MIIARLVSLGACGYIIAPTLRQSDATFRPEAISLGNTLSFAPPSRESGRAPLFALPFTHSLLWSSSIGVLPRAQISNQCLSLNLVTSVSRCLLASRTL